MIALLAGMLVVCGACANMTRTEKTTLAGAAIGAGAGVGIAALARGYLGVGAVVGGALGAVAGNLYGKEQERREAYYPHHHYKKAQKPQPRPQEETVPQDQPTL